MKQISADNPSNKPKDTKPTMSTFKANTPTKTFTATSPNRSSFTLSNHPSKDYKPPTDNSLENNKNQKLSTTPSNAATPKILERQVTPPKIRTRKPSPSRLNTSTNPKPAPKTAGNPKTNSPDLVTSCSNKKPNGPKPPDVLSGSVKKNSTVSGGGGILTKPHVPNLPKTAQKAAVKNVTNPKSVEIHKSGSDVTKTNANAGVKATKLTSGSTDSKVMPSGVRLAARQQSNVASLQQKFENKPPITAKIGAPISTATVKK